ncbi:Uncharacterized protein DBV15_11739 [Temnothorax longispinosus]|uniref:Uncharacterized protein n=1 Tax=Temnothorax longispinosus TaxID=300112 RepID=A0A4S2L2Q4_9HYME|nr:Uncharacterized protein DBV15_11739 [Temnothorax longispinosus]
MDFSGSTEDPHTFAKPEQARVTDIHLELIVDFKQKVLKGKAILTIKKKSSISGIFLDNYGLIISRVTNIDGTDLDYHVGIHHIFGSSFYVELPPTVDTTCNSNNECKIEIEYKTSSDSPALYWLTSAQTANGTHPFLLSNNKLIYARAWFPCQDTPSVKFTYTAKILVPKHFTVLMSALLQAVDRVGPELEVHEFRQIDPVPSYAVIIAVGSLQIRYLNEKSNMFIEKKFIDEPPDTFLINTGINTIERMLEIAKSLCGPYPWGKITTKYVDTNLFKKHIINFTFAPYQNSTILVNVIFFVNTCKIIFVERYDICVLPPNVAHLKIECPRVIFISPTLLGGDLTSISSLARNISQSWAGNYVTCSNYEHLWLNKSFSIFISRKIKSKLLMQIKDIKSFLERKEQNDLNNMIQGMEHPHMLKCLLPNLTCLLPHKATEYIPYETGCMLLDHLEEILGGSSVFELFLKSYFHEFAFKSINTQDWINYLYQYFSDEKEVTSFLYKLQFH